jgi:hypothetical protein
MFLPLLLALGLSAQAAGPEAIKAASGRVFDRLPELPPFHAALAEEEPKLITLSQLAERLSQDPEAMADLVERIKKGTEKLGAGWPGLDGLSPADRARLAEAVRRADKSFLDRFPVMTVDGLKLFVAEFGRRQGPAPAEPPFPAEENLALPGKPANPAPGAFLKDWGHGLKHGDKSLSGPQPTAFGDDARAAEILNRLALNVPGSAPAYTLNAGGAKHASVTGFLGFLLAHGHTLSAKDMRFFANFGGLWHESGGRMDSVVTPLFVDSGVTLPDGTRAVVPAGHAHLQLDISGPAVNARVIYFLGVGGSAQFYPLATLDKPWVGGRAAASWSGQDALRLAGRAAVTRRELIAKAKRYALPLGGYGPLGACADIHAMIVEKPVYPQIRDMRYFADGSEMDAWAAALPVDSDAVKPALSRLWDSRPFETLADLKVEASRPVYSQLAP